MKKTLFFIASIIWTACSSDQVQERDLPDKGRILIIGATKGQTNTRGLDLDGNTLSAFWEEGDEVSVLKDDGTFLGTLEPETTGSSSTTLKSTGPIDVSDNQNLTLIFPGIKHGNSISDDDIRDYTGQKGTIDNIAKYYDYATASVTVSLDNNGSTASTSQTATFENQQAIVRFTLKYGSNDLNVNSLTITAANGLLQKESTTGKTTGPITITPKTPTKEIFAALSGDGDNIEDKITLTATDGNYNYFYTTSDLKTFTDGNFYSVTVKMKKEYPEPLTLKCFEEGGCRVWVTGYKQLELDYLVSTSTGSTGWKTYPNETIDGDIILSNGQWVSFCGDYATQGGNDYMNIHCNGKCYVYGNVMSLLSKDNFATMTDLPYDNTFQNLFMDNENIFHANGKDLVLPATKLEYQCYYQMFSGCTNLNYVKCLATDISAESCTTYWLSGVSKDGTFVKAEDFDGWTLNSDSGIPQGWTVTEE